MGQYYRPVLKQNDKTTVYNRNVDGEYTLAKLMEHSWWDNDLLVAIGKKLYKKKGQLAWVGDYSEYEDCEKLNVPMSLIDIAWGKNVRGRGLKKVNNFIFDNKYLCNHSIKRYINLKTYYVNHADNNDCINPLSLLTAVGNGRGGGDYFGLNSCDIGIWAWDIISIEDEIPENYLESTPLFRI